MVVSKGYGKGRVDQVPYHQTLVTHLNSELLSALVRFTGTRDRTLSTVRIKSVEWCKVWEEGKKIFVFWGLGRGGGGGLERRLLGFLKKSDITEL